MLQGHSIEKVASAAQRVLALSDSAVYTCQPELYTLPHHCIAMKQADQMMSGCPLGKRSSAGSRKSDGEGGKRVKKTGGGRGRGKGKGKGKGKGENGAAGEQEEDVEEVSLEDAGYEHVGVGNQTGVDTDDSGDSSNVVGGPESTNFGGMCSKKGGGFVAPVPGRGPQGTATGEGASGGGGGGGGGEAGGGGGGSGDQGDGDGDKGGSGGSGGDVDMKEDEETNEEERRDGKGGGEANSEGNAGAATGGETAGSMENETGRIEHVGGETDVEMTDANAGDETEHVPSSTNVAGVDKDLYSRTIAALGEDVVR